MLIVLVLLSSVAAVPLCGPSELSSPILAFELVRGPAEIAEIFGTEPCRSTLAAAQHRGLMLDALGFVPAYGLFLGFALAALRRVLPRVALYGAAFLFLGVILDEIENGLLLGVLRDLPSDEAVTGPLYWVVRLKFVAIGMAELMTALLLARRRWLGTLASVPMLFGGLLGLLLLVTNPHNSAMMDAHAVAWVPLLIVAIIYSWRRPSASAF